MAHYKLDSRRISFAEYWRLSPSLLGVLWMWGAKLLGKKVRLAVGVPGPLPVREMIVDKFEISPEARTIFGEMEADLASAGLRQSHFLKVKDSLMIPHAEISCADFVERRGELWARCFVVEQPQPLPKIKKFVVVFTRLADGRFVITSNKPREMKSSTFVIPAYLTTGNIAEVIAEHRRRIEKFRAKPGLLMYRTDAEAEPWIDEYERRGFEESRAEGRYIEMTPEEVAAARAAKYPEPPSAAAPAEGEAFMPSYEKKAREVMSLMEEQLNRTQSWGNGLMFFVVTLAVFAAVAKMRWSGQTVLMVLGVLFFHELGHFVAMKVFRYQNVRMFFIPFFGAAVTGKRMERSAWKSAVVALMGPGPGLIIGFLVLLAGIATERVELERLARMLILINGFNLLPLTPLDGGWVMQALFFMRHPLAESLFKGAAAGIIVILGITMHMYIFAMLGGFMLLSLPLNHKLGKIAAGLKTTEEGPLEGTYSPTLVERIVEEVRPLSPGADLRTIATMTSAVYEKVVAKPPPLWATVLLLIAYLGFVAIGIEGFRLYMLARQF
jgi:Zn-dependent protease